MEKQNSLQSPLFCLAYGEGSSPYTGQCYDEGDWLMAKEAVLTQENVTKRGLPCVPGVTYVVKLLKLLTICFYIASTPIICGEYS